MKPYRLQTKRVKSRNDQKGKWSRTEWANFLRRDKKKARQESKKQISSIMDEVKINPTPICKATLHFEDEYIGEITSQEQLLDVQIQVKNLARAGYYLLFDGHKIPIKQNGKIEKWVDGFFDQAEKLLDELLGF